jgi:hypothetical protein
VRAIFETSFAVAVILGSARNWIALNNPNSTKKPDVADFSVRLPDADYLPL